MIDDLTYALMAGDSYISTRPAINQFPAPKDWIEFNHRSLDNGFEAVTFTDGTGPQKGSETNCLEDPTHVVIQRQR